jgi:signal transduction histidine kinase
VSTSPRTWMDRLAHDLRGPLSPMLTAVYLLRDGQTTPEQRAELLQVMERQIQRLGGMIDEVSDLGRAEKGRLVARREPVDLELLVADVVARMHAEPPDVTVSPALQGVELEGDVVRMGQLFRTLLGLRLSRAEPRPVRARLEPSATGVRMACVLDYADVSDAEVEALLEAPQPDPPDDALGLGLMIARAIAEAHGGTLRGRAGAGATIELLLELPTRTSGDGDAAGA